MSEIIIDKEFEFVLPPLDDATFAWLEESILEYGCQQPLVLWNNILIDGYNRYRILTKHDLTFSTVSMEFDSRDEVLIWMVSNQVSRRNLSPMQLTYFRGLHYNADKRLKGNRAGTNRYVTNLELHHNDGILESNETAKKLAEHYNVSQATIERDARVANAIIAIGEKSPEAKRSILAGKTTISRKKLRELASDKGNRISEVATQISDGTFVSVSSESTGSVADVGNGSEMEEPKDNSHVNVQELTEVAVEMAEELYASLLKRADGDSDALKKMLKASIDVLEGHYGRI